MFSMLIYDIDRYMGTRSVRICSLVRVGENYHDGPGPAKARWHEWWETCSPEVFLSVECYSYLLVAGVREFF